MRESPHPSLVSRVPSSPSARAQVSAAPPRVKNPRPLHRRRRVASRRVVVPLRHRGVTTTMFSRAFHRVSRLPCTQRANARALVRGARARSAPRPGTIRKPRRSMGAIAAIAARARRARRARFVRRGSRAVRRCAIGGVRTRVRCVRRRRRRLSTTRARVRLSVAPLERVRARFHATDGRRGGWRRVVIRGRGTRSRVGFGRLDTSTVACPRRSTTRVVFCFVIRARA